MEQENVYGSRPPQQPVRRSENDTYSYRGWLQSDNFWKRAFAVWGYYFVAQLVISAGILVVMVVLVLLMRATLM